MNYRDLNFKVRQFKKKVFEKYEMHKVCKVDSFMAQPFNKSAFGWSRNSIAAMANAVNYSEFLAIAQQIAKTPAQYNLPKGCSLNDAMALCRPRFAQSPYELDLFAKQLAENDMQKLNEQYLKNISTSQSVVETKVVENPIVVDTPSDEK